MCGAAGTPSAPPPPAVCCVECMHHPPTTIRSLPRGTVEELRADGVSSSDRQSAPADGHLPQLLLRFSDECARPNHGNRLLTKVCHGTVFHWHKRQQTADGLETMGCDTAKTQFAALEDCLKGPAQYFNDISRSRSSTNDDEQDEEMAKMMALNEMCRQRAEEQNSVSNGTFAVQQMLGMPSVREGHQCAVVALGSANSVLNLVTKSES
ncbi:hypothetical protein niasHT_008623 [Heterodera trifolii]|uniref:Uncharacterized protein n=1 Tax=Heterodera trifolii TaxID=157864 RepID=A0ABD2LW46_9BILA